MSSDEKPKDSDKLFAILNTDDQNLQWIKLSQLLSTNNLVHGMGMTYNKGKYFCAGIIPSSQRLKSIILTINLETGEKKLNHLLFTKAIHGLKSIDNNRLLACSTQTDIISELIIENGNVVNEDLFKHMAMPDRWECVLNEELSKSGQNPYYRGDKLIDDNHHVNSIEIINNKILCTMFGYRSWEKEHKRYVNDDGLYDGVLYDLKNCKIILNNLRQPHTAFINSRGSIGCCDSANFTFIIKNRFKVELDGYTRGICEDTKAKGYWVGISAYRKKRFHDGKWVRLYKKNKELNGARIQFVDYDGKIRKTIELEQYGEEIFDLISTIDGGNYN